VQPVNATNISATICTPALNCSGIGPSGSSASAALEHLTPNLTALSRGHVATLRRPSFWRCCRRAIASLAPFQAVRTAQVGEIGCAAALRDYPAAASSIIAFAMAMGADGADRRRRRLPVASPTRQCLRQRAYRTLTR
jgi:hypothetical protein